MLLRPAAPYPEDNIIISGTLTKVLKVTLQNIHLLLYFYFLKYGKPFKIGLCMYF